MKAHDLNEKTVDELNEELLTQLKEQFTFRMQKSTGQLNQTHLMRRTRRNIARIKTVLKQKAGN